MAGLSSVMAQSGTQRTAEGAIFTENVKALSLKHTEAPGIITGTIRDAVTGEPLPGASVIIQGTSKGAAANLRGKYTISAVPEGEHLLVASYLGYMKMERTVNVDSGEELEINFQLRPQSVEGEEVVVTAQAQGQRQAINQQLSSNTITDVVSEARIKELPDVNAAESIGRLPGVSIQRTGGEATQVAIRGLSPKYNTVSVNGVRLPSTSGSNRTTDLSLISSNMLDGIEVKKAVTPDQDADALGGSVDLKLKEAPDSLVVNASAQLGYSHLQEYLGNYKINASASDRFLDNKLGIIASFNADEYDRSADKFSGSYNAITRTNSNELGTVIADVGLREENVIRGRTGASMVMDYKISNGQLKANAFYNRLHSENLYRINQMYLSGFNANRRNYNLEDRNSTTDIFTGALAIEQEFSWIRYDGSIAYTASHANSPGDFIYQFRQEGGAFSTVDLGFDVPADSVPKLATPDSTQIALQNVYKETTDREENQYIAQLNVQVPYSFGDNINGYIKTGGKVRWLDRYNEVDQIGRGGLHYGNTSGPNAQISAIHRANEQYGWWDFNVEDLVTEYGWLPMYPFYDNYSRPDFLDGQYPLGPVAEQDKMRKIFRVLEDSSYALSQSIPSRQNDYQGDEKFQAAYLMSEINFGNLVTLIGGVRYESSTTTYQGQQFKEVTVNNQQAPPAELDTLKITRENSFLLPMVQAKIEPTDWLDIRLSRTETLTRPDYLQYAPITTINSFGTYINAANTQLDPAHATNYDATLSIYQKHIGLFTVSGFYKEIEDLIFQTSFTLHNDLRPAEGEDHVIEGLTIPNSWYRENPQLDTDINNPYKSRYRGIEVSWQANFWYLPRIFQGLVFNANYTRIHSEMEMQRYKVYDTDSMSVDPPPVPIKGLKDTTRMARMPDQPNHIANVTIGYDYKGFSGRISMLYQANQAQFIGSQPIYDNFTGEYIRFDASLQQRLYPGLQLFANFNNINGRADRSYRGEALEEPTYIEYYGLTVDVGVRYTF